MRKQKKNSQYILYAALILLPLILSAVLFFQMRSVINKEIERHADQTSLQFYLQTSSMIHELHSFSSNLADDSEVIRVLSSENGSDVNKSEFCEYISSKVTETRDIKYTYILSESNGRIFSNEGYYSYISIESLLKKIGLVSQNYDFEHYGIDLTLYNESGYAPFCVTPVIDNSGENRGAAIGYIIAALDYRKFIENFHTLDATVCAVYSDNFYISSIIDATKMDDINWSDPDQVNKLVGEPVTCVYRSDSDYNYMVGISNTEYYQPIRLLLTGFCIYFALLLIAGLLILWRLLKKRRDESLSHIKERNLRYILYGHNSRIINEKFVNDAGLSKDPHQLYIVALFFAEIRKKHTFQDIEQAVLHYLPETGLSCTYYDDLSGMVFVFWNENDPSSLEEQVNRVCHSVTQDLLGSQSMFVQICTSSPVQGVIELENAFHQTSDMHEKMDPVHHSKPVVNMSDIDRTTPNESDSFMRSLQVLMNALIAGKYDQIPENVRQIQSVYIDPVADNIEFARTRRRTLANILSNALMESNLGNDEKEIMHKDFRHAMESEELNKITELYFSKAAAINTSDARDTSTYEKAISFIQENLQDHNMSVTMICDALGISVQKLTRIFHSNNSNDMAVAEYVNLLRVQKAQDLLTSRKELSVSEIADMAGYNNSHSLTRNFRKFTGLTPTEYRELEGQS